MSQHRLLAAAAVAALAAPAVVAAQSPLEKLQIHGYLTQGFGASDSLPIVGITNQGSADHRAAALQLRFAATAKDVAVVQLANRRMGESILNGLEDVVHVQWAYYQRRLGAGFTAKAGRAPLPRGIFNEVRKVGTVLPFYRAPYSFYTEGYETMDGGFVRHDARLGAWELETSVFGGRFDYRQAITRPVYAPRMAAVNGQPRMVGVDYVRDSALALDRKASKAFGGQVWLVTPVQGLRVGAGGTRFELSDFSELAGKVGPVGSSIVQAALDGNFTRFQLRGEWEQQESHEFNYTAWYVQGGVKLTEKLSLHAQREEAVALVAGRAPILGVPVDASPVSRSRNRHALDHGVSVNYAFRPNLVVKAEGHDNRGGNWDRRTTGNPSGRYFITSVAFAF